MIFRPIFTTVAASRDMNARTLEWESTGANVQRLRPLPRSLDLGSGNSLVIMLSQRYISNSLSWQHWCNINCFKQKGDNKTWQMKLCLRCSLVVVQRADICIEYFLYLRVPYLIFKCFFFLFLPNVTGVT